MDRWTTCGLQTFESSYSLCSNSPSSESWRRQLRISTHMPTHRSPTHSSHVIQIHSPRAQLFVIHNVLTANSVKVEVKYPQTGGALWDLSAVSRSDMSQINSAAGDATEALQWASSLVLQVWRAGFQLSGSLERFSLLSFLLIATLTVMKWKRTNWGKRQTIADNTHPDPPGGQTGHAATSEARFRVGFQRDSCNTSL